MRSRSASLALLTALALCLLAAAPAANGASGVAVRVGATPRLPAGTRTVGSAPAGEELNLYVALQPRDPAALESFANEVATPGSPFYGDYLSVPQFAQRFGATPAQIATVRSALSTQGLEVGAAGANGLSLAVQATVAEAEGAFGIGLDRVALPSGRVAHANDRAPAIAAAAAPFVQGVLGLDDVATSHRHDSGGPASSPAPAWTAAAPAVPTLATGGPQPCQEALEVQEAEGGYTADQIAAAYRFDGLYKAGNFGAGQTVALLELQPLLKADVDTYQACYGTDVSVDKVDVNGGPTGANSDDGEAALDVEQLIGLAPGVHVLVYQGPNEGDTEVEIFAKYVQQNLAKVMSSSWGACEPETELAETIAFDTLLQEAAAQGQSFFAAAGDYGSSDCYSPPHDLDESLAVDFPGADPFTTDVGGTRLEDPTATPPTEYLWNDAPEWGAGGSGVSAYFPMPPYQREAAPGLNVLGPLSSGAQCGVSGYCRQVPDVSAEASAFEHEGRYETGYVIHAEGEWEVNGGTSAAAPLWAATTALINASPACGGHTVGFANPALYVVAAADYAANFQDVTEAKPGGKPTTNRFDDSEPFPAGPAYDMASGLGTPIVPGLAASLCALATQVPSPPTPSGGSTTPAGPLPSALAPFPTVSGGSLIGVAKGKPKLAFTVTARPGARLRTVNLELPPGLVATGSRSPYIVRFQLAKPRFQARLRLAFPALSVTPKLLERVRSGRTKRLGFVLAVRETGGRGARLPLELPLG
jgi:Pro-kumamolisin, activation domain/Subtilase family